MVALVTGGGRGIGREIALTLARAGHPVAVAARTCEQVEATAEAARALGVAARALALDVTHAASVEAAVGEVVATLGPVEVLVNNAGIAQAAPFLKVDPELWQRHLDVNVTGPYLVTRAVLAGMLARKFGRIINIASLAGLYGAPYVTAYTASKHALVGLTRALAMEVSGTGVTVNAVCPGYVATDMVWDGARAVAAKTGKSFEEVVAAMAAMNPGRRLIEPAEVAAAAVKLVADGETNGQTIMLDGTTPT